MSNVELKLKDTINDNDIYDIYIDNVYVGGLEANYDPRINSFYIENIKKSDSYKAGHLLEDVVNYLYNDKGYDLGCLPLEKYRGYYEELGFTPFIYNDNDVYYHKIHKGDNMKTDEFLNEVKKILEEDNNLTQKFNRDTARDYAKEFYRSIYGPNRYESPYKDKILDYSGDLRNIENWPNTVDDIFDHEHNLLSVLYVQDQHASNDEEHKKFREQYNTIFDDAIKALKNVDKRERFNLIDNYYHNRYKNGGVTDDMDGYRTEQIKCILQSFGYDISSKSDMRKAYKELKEKFN